MSNNPLKKVRWWWPAALIAAAVASGMRPAEASSDFPAGASYQAYFSPNGRAIQAMADVVNSAKVEVMASQMLLQSPALLNALAAAAGRPSAADKTKRVQVYLLIDKRKTDTLKPVIRSLYLSGALLREDGAEPINLGKVLIVDGHTVVIGSTDPTPNGDTRNAGNTLVLRGVPALAKAYAVDFAKHWSHSAWIDVKRVLRDPVIDPLTGERLD